MRQFTIKINGIDIDARYTEDNINKIFIPLLQKLTDMQRAANKRILVMLAAPPGTGKSTLCEFLKHLSETTPDLTPIQVIGMDGFHRYQDYLTSHTTIRDGQEIMMVKIKGAPVTFDLDLLKDRIIKVSSGENTGWPIYDRLTHNPLENAITINGDIIILEGNYLLLNTEGWNEIKDYADYTIRISATEKDLQERLIDRKIKSGASPVEAAEFVENSDLYNVRTCLKHTVKADLNMKLNADDSYSIIGNTTHYSSEPDIPDCGCIYG